MSFLNKIFGDNKGLYSKEKTASVPMKSIFKSQEIRQNDDGSNARVIDSTDKTQEAFLDIVELMSQAKLLGRLEGPTRDMLEAVRKLNVSRINENDFEAAKAYDPSVGYAQLTEKEVIACSNAHYIISELKWNLKAYQNDELDKCDQSVLLDKDVPSGGLEALARKEIKENTFGNDQAIIKDSFSVLTDVSNNVSSIFDRQLNGGILGFTEKQGMKFTEHQKDTEFGYDVMIDSYKTAGNLKKVAKAQYS